MHDLITGQNSTQTEMVHRSLLGEYKWRNSLCSFYLLRQSQSDLLTFFLPSRVHNWGYLLHQKAHAQYRPPPPVTNTQITHISECSLWSNAKLHVWVKIYVWWYPCIPRSKQITFAHSVSQLVYWPYFSTFTITIYDCKPANTLLFLELHWLCNIAIHKNASKCRFHMLTIMQVQNWCSRNVDMVTFPPLLPHHF